MITNSTKGAFANKHNKNILPSFPLLIFFHGNIKLLQLYEFITIIKKAG